MLKQVGLFLTVSTFSRTDSNQSKLRMGYSFEVFLKCTLLLLTFAIFTIAGSFSLQNNWWRSRWMQRFKVDEHRWKQFWHSMFLDLSFSLFFFAFCSLTCSGPLSRRSSACPYDLEAANPQQNWTDIMTLSRVEDSFPCI